MDYSNAKMRLQSFFMLITVQRCPAQGLPDTKLGTFTQAWRARPECMDSDIRFRSQFSRRCRAFFHRNLDSIRVLKFADRAVK